MSAINYTRLKDVTIYGNTATGGNGDNIYYAGGELTNVVSQNSEHRNDELAVVGHRLNLEENSEYLYEGYAEDLEGVWVQDEEYSLTGTIDYITYTQTRYVRTENPKYYYYVIKTDEEYDGVPPYTGLFSRNANFDVGGNDSGILLDIISGFTFPVTPGVGSGEYYFTPVYESWTENLSRGTDLYLADEAATTNITYSAFGTINTNGKTLENTNIQNLQNTGVFQSTNTRNYRLIEGSPLIGSGIMLGGIGSDIANTARVSKDIGAYTSPLYPGIPNTGSR